MRRPRRHCPGQYFDLTIRCWRGEFRLRPDETRRELIGFWLAKALARCPGIRLIAVCQMSNHLHLLIEDGRGEVSALMQYFVGHLAKALNKLDQIRGSVFERRFAEIVVLDEEALANRVAYAINNPVEANLARRHEDWSGLCRYAASAAVRMTFTQLREQAYWRALEEAARSDGEVDEGDYMEVAELELAALGPDLAAQVARAVDARGAELRAKQASIVGAAEARKVSPLDRPKVSSRSAMPLLFASKANAVLRSAFLRGWRTFVAAFRRASEAFRSGVLDAVFPDYSYRPSIPWVTGERRSHTKT